MFPPKPTLPTLTKPELFNLRTNDIFCPEMFLLQKIALCIALYRGQHIWLLLTRCWWHLPQLWQSTRYCQCRLMREGGQKSLQVENHFIKMFSSDNESHFSIFLYYIHHSKCLAIHLFNTYYVFIVTELFETSVISCWTISIASQWIIVIQSSEIYNESVSVILKCCFWSTMLIKTRTN